MGESRAGDADPGGGPVETWADLITVLPLRDRMTISAGLLDGLAALHRTLYATGAGPLDEMLAQLTAAIEHLARTHEALATGIARHGRGGCREGLPEH